MRYINGQSTLIITKIHSPKHEVHKRTNNFNHKKIYWKKGILGQLEKNDDDIVQMVDNDNSLLFLSDKI